MSPRPDEILSRLDQLAGVSLAAARTVAVVAFALGAALGTEAEIVFKRRKGESSLDRPNPPCAPAASNPAKKGAS
jgi:hypothetical protein